MSDRPQTPRNDPYDVSDIFNDFVNREVRVKEISRIHTSSIIGTYEYIEKIPHKDDPTLEAMRAFAKEKKLSSLRVMFADTTPSLDHVYDRVTVYLEKKDDGKWRVSQKIRLG